jgi:signal transduction histidine kinase
MHPLVRAVAEEVRASFPDRRIRYEHSGPGIGQWDPSRTAQVVSNLVSNAFRHGAPDAEVVVRSTGGRGGMVLEVHNRGPAIDPALLPQLFEPLRSGRARGGASVGLGLYIVDQIVRAHGGEVAVRSSEAEGTTFTVRLPHAPAGP